MTRRNRLWLAILMTAAVLRVLTLSAYPLHDTTEARYAEIARLMVVSGDWITPQIEIGVPFWAKPPLSVWLTATSFKLFGFSEFTARVPALALTLLTAALLFKVGRRFLSSEAAIASCAILFTCVVGFVASGAVMTDATLMFATTLSLIAFWMAACEPQSRWRYGFFVGLALGLLAKGPIAIVLVGLPVLTWSLWQKSFAWLWRALPWLTGSLLMLAIAAPWYWFAEVKTPGFLEYFLIGEHWLRFVESGWQGDYYGHAHVHPRGSIWLYGLVAALPWSLIALYALVAAVKRGGALRSLSSMQAYLLLWMLAPLLFFTFSGNLLWVYVLPAIPAFALLLGEWLVSRNTLYIHSGWIVPLIFLAAMLTNSVEVIAHNSQRDMVEFHDTLTDASELYYFPKLPYSASFYSHGRARAIYSESDLSALLAPTFDGHIVMRKRKLDKISGRLRACLRIEKEIHDHYLLRKSAGCEWQR